MAAGVGLRLDRSEASRGDAFGHAQVEVGRAGGARLGEHARRRGPLAPRRPSPEPKIRSGPSRRSSVRPRGPDHRRSMRSRNSGGAPAGDAERAERAPVGHALAGGRRARRGASGSPRARTPVQHEPVAPDAATRRAAALDRGDRPRARAPRSRACAGSRPDVEARDRRVLRDGVAQRVLAHVQRGHVERGAARARCGSAAPRSSLPPVT